ncbi:pilus assembly protein [Marinobacterium maritimum]|uniref:Pilus assembly protein n=1 Tax=Marinobacterium maritimum TaxID=500162 RepID=A0ABN1I6S7_9GAMM
MNVEHNTFTPFSQQRGATLVVAMIMLVLISIIGFSAMQTTTMQERMVGNLKDREISFQAAEAALRAKEKWLSEQRTLPELEDTFSEYGNTGVTELKAVSADPEARMEEKSFLPDSLDIGHEMKTGVDIYKIEALGQGQSEYARTRLESIYARRFN